MNGNRLEPVAEIVQKLKNRGKKSREGDRRRGANRKNGETGKNAAFQQGEPRST